MDLQRITLYIDGLFCLIILPLIIIMVPIDKWIVNYPIFALTLVSFIYTCYFVYRKVKIPQLFMQKKYLHIIIILTILFVATYFISQFPYPKDSIPKYSTIEIRNYRRAQTVWFMFLIVSGFSLAIELLLELFKQMLQKKEIEAEKNKAKLALYKAQINPHFLFNTLNTLYGLIICKSDNAEKALVNISDILKYTYSHTTDNTIPIEDEVKYIDNYIDLQALRLNHHTQVSWSNEIDNPKTLIPPMILITFIENAFKYGISSTKDCSISISLLLKNNTLSFSTLNSIMTPNKTNPNPIGIANCRNRLNLLFPNKYALTIKEEDDLFELNLKINLK